VIENGGYGHRGDPVFCTLFFQLLEMSSCVITKGPVGATNDSMQGGHVLYKVGNKSIGREVGKVGSEWDNEHSRDAQVFKVSHTARLGTDERWRGLGAEYFGGMGVEGEDPCLAVVWFCLFFFFFSFASARLRAEVRVPFIPSLERLGFSGTGYKKFICFFSIHKTPYKNSYTFHKNCATG